MLPSAVLAILRRLKENGHAAYAVGGCVRDQLLCRAPADWDIATSARPEQVMELFAGHCIPTGLQHGTVTVRQDQQSFEVTTFRADGNYSDHRHPDTVQFSDDLREDLARRDFTIGAMAMDDSGTLTDPYGGQEDLRRRVIRCVGEADRRFDEDALRIMRALRFASVLDFTVEPETTAAIRRGREQLHHIAAERIRVEMDQLLCGAAAERILLEFPEVIGVFLPEMLGTVGLDQRNPHHCFNVWEHTARAVSSVPPVPLLRWTMLFHDLGKSDCFTVDAQGIGHFYGHGKISCRMADQAMRRLKFGTAARERITLLIDWHDRDIPRTHKSLRRALHALGEEALWQLLEVKRADNLAQAPEYRAVQTQIDRAAEIVRELLAEDACFSLKQLAVNGRDMMALGLTGAAIGAMLDHLLHQVLDEQLPNERSALLSWAREQIKSQ